MLLYVHNNTEELIDLYSGSIAADEKVLINQTTAREWAENEEILNLVLNEKLIIYTDAIALEPIDGIKILMGNGGTGDITLDIERDVNGRIKMAIAPETHGETHGKDQTDEIDVTGLSGVLSDPQRPISEDVVLAMGDKSNINPLNHDRFQQSEISNLSETQLNLNNPSHSNINDPTPNQKAAFDANTSLSSTNSVASMSDLIPGIQGEKGDSGKDFRISKTYISIIAMEDDIDNISEYDFAMVDTGNVEDEDTGKLYYKLSSLWHYVGDLSGASGIKGESGVDGIDGINGETISNIGLVYHGSVKTSYRYFSQCYKFDTRYTPLTFRSNMKIKSMILSSKYKRDCSGDDYEVCFIALPWGSSDYTDTNNSSDIQSILISNADKVSDKNHMVEWSNSAIASNIILDNNKQYSIAIRRISGDQYLYYPLLTIEMEEV